MNIVSLGIFAILFLLIMGFITQLGAMGISSNLACTSSSSDVYCNNYRNVVTMGCHLPIMDGWDTSTSLNTDQPILTHNGNGTYYECGFNISGQYTARYPRNYQTTAFNTIPTGWYFYSGDTLTQYFYKMGAMAGMTLNFLTPINFNILGYTIADMSGLALAVIIAIYALCYLFISVMIYKFLSPFAGAG